jgi:hypothetical protein
VAGYSEAWSAPLDQSDSTIADAMRTGFARIDQTSAICGEMRRFGPPRPPVPDQGSIIVGLIGVIATILARGLSGQRATSAAR